MLVDVPELHLVSGREFDWAVQHAHTEAKYARGQAEEALLSFKLTAALRCPIVVDSELDTVAHTQLRLSVAENLATFSDNTRTHATRESISGVLKMCAIFTSDDEKDAREKSKNAKLAELNETIAKAAQLMSRALRLEAVAGFKAMHTDKCMRFLVWETVCEKCGTAESVDLFRAFKGAGELEFVQKLLEGKMKKFMGLEELQVSEYPINLGKLGEGDFELASLLERGLIMDDQQELGSRQRAPPLQPRVGEEESHENSKA
eukprot:gnl/Chilomastix_cuspidata/4543.p1 GENE.gnl/Chilomastix_cuspidata/4543~~gnl/Chilomastix_cuspidata/4543.p1  ORF type:complete len:261 (+),score=54.76 gnl/Chilomastix_cuspidata/4543:201-983(+)